MSKRLNGIYQNCDPIDQPEGFYRNAENIILDEEIGGVLNEKGTTRNTTTPDESTTIGSYLLPNDDRVVFLNTNEIGLFTGSSYTTLLNNSILNFSSDYPIQSDFYIDKYGDRILVWVDGINPARFLNIDNPEIMCQACLGLFPSISEAPRFTVNTINNVGGSLKTGVYYIAIAYKHSDETLTNFYDVVGPIPITKNSPTSDRAFKGSNEDVRTSKSITLSFTNIDKKYESIQLAIIPKIGNVFDAVQLLPEIPITTTEYTYTGNESFTTGALEEIQIDQAFYSKPKTIHINDDTIYLGNLEEKQDIGYQQYAKNIVVKSTTKSLANFSNGEYDLENSYRNPNNVVYNKGFKRGEVYALYISWLLKEGGESKAYHIPGRDYKSSTEKNASDKFTSYEENPEIFSEFVGMGVWENEGETYPNDSEVWGDLAGEPVRHHFFPEQKDRPLISGGFSENVTANVLGFKLENVELPAHLEDQVVGYKVYYAKRTPENTRVLDQAVNLPNRLTDGLYRPEPGTAFGNDPQVFYLHPFNYLRTKKELGDLTHLKVQRNALTTFNESTIVNTTIRLYNHSNTQNAPSSARIREVVAQSYIDSQDEVSNINLTPLGFAHNMDNNRGESKIIVRLNEGYAPFGIQDNPWYICDMLSFKSDMYNSFDNQILESTNYIHTDLEQLDSDGIFGGDTFINTYTFRANKRVDVDNFSGIHTFICESRDNISHRTTGDFPWEQFYPQFDYVHLAALAWKDGVPYFFGDFSSDNIDVKTYDNYFAYNEDYSQTNDIRFIEQKKKINQSPKRYPTRAIRNKGDTRTLTRTFLPNDFIDLSTKRGELIKLSTYNNILIPHMERSLIRTRGREELQVGDIRAFLGSGDIFSTKPEELIYSEDGFGGISKKEHSINTPFGYAFYDVDASKIFLITNEGLQDIGEPIKPTLDSLSPSFVRLGYDPKFERLFITMDNQTWSYSFKIGGWISKHNFIPDWYMHTKDIMYTAKSNGLYEHNINNVRGTYYNEKFGSSYSYVDNREPNVSKVAMSLMIQSIVRNTNNSILRTKTFDKFRIRNSSQDSGIVDIVYFATDPTNPYIGNARKTVNKWFINQFRDISGLEGIPNSERWKYRRKLEDHYHIVDLIKEHSNGEKITLTDTDLIYKNSIR